MNINMSSPTSKNARHLSKTVEYPGIVQGSNHIKNPYSPKKGNSSRFMQNKKPLRQIDSVTDVASNSSLHNNIEKSSIQSLPIETLYQKEIDSNLSHYKSKESVQCETLDVSLVKKLTAQQENTSQPKLQSPKEQKVSSPSEGQQNVAVKNPSKEQESVAQLNSKLSEEYEDEPNKMRSAITTRKEIYEAPESLPLDTNTDCPTSAVDRKKERRKIVKQLARDGKRKQHELEYKKNIHFPKGQRIQVIDCNTFQKISKDAGSFHNENKGMVLNPEEFPALNLLKHNSRFSAGPCQDSSVQSNTEISRVQDKAIQNMRLSMNVSETHSLTNSEMINKPEKLNEISNKQDDKSSLKKVGKLPKKRDPIQIDILQCIKMVKEKAAVVDPKRKFGILDRRKGNSLISGNELDSSNPQRSRGKKRENPKKKRPTRLKLVILQERELKNQLKKLQKSDSSWAENGCFEMDTPKNFLTAVGSQSESIKPVVNVLDSEIVQTVPEVKDLSKEDKYKYEVYSPEDSTALAGTNPILNAEAHSQAFLQNNPYTIDKQWCTNEESMPSSVLCPTADIMKNEKQEFIGSRNETCSIISLKQDQHSIPTSDDKRCTHLSSHVNNCEFLNCSLGEHHNESVVTDNLTDPGTSSKLQYTNCMTVPRDKVCDSTSNHAQTAQKTELHSRKFRPYCDHLITPEINSSTTALVQDIVKFHDRQFERDPVKANARRRHVTGLREVLKYLNLKRLKLIVIAPDMELTQAKGGISDIVEQLKEGARNQEIPYVFALHRRALGKITFKKVPVSCVGVINYDGTEKNFHSLVAALQIARTQYQEALADISHQNRDTGEVDVYKQVIEVVLSKLTENSSTSHAEQNLVSSETDKERQE